LHQLQFKSVFLSKGGGQGESFYVGISKYTHVSTLLDFTKDIREFLAVQITRHELMEGKEYLVQWIEKVFEEIFVCTTFMIQNL